MKRIADMTPKARKRALDKRYSISQGLAGAHGAAAGAELGAFCIAAPSASGVAYRNHQALSDMYHSL